MSKARDLANLGSNTAALATDAEVSSAVAPKANTTDVNNALALKADTSTVNSSLTTKADSSTVSAHTGASTGVHGATGSVVGTSDAQTLTNKTVDKAVLISPEERMTISAISATGTINFDAVTQSVMYYTSNASANYTLNVRGNSGTTLNSMLAVGDSITVVFLNTNGATAYYQTAFQVDGSSVTPKWQGGTTPTSGSANSIDAYTFTIIKTASTPTYLVLASVSKFA